MPRLLVEGFGAFRLKCGLRVGSEFQVGWVICLLGDRGGWRMSDVLHFGSGAMKWNMSGTFGGEFGSGFVDIGGLTSCVTVCTVCVYLQKCYCVECATDECIPV